MPVTSEKKSSYWSVDKVQPVCRHSHSCLLYYSCLSGFSPQIIRHFSGHQGHSLHMPFCLVHYSGKNRAKSIFSKFFVPQDIVSVYGTSNNQIIILVYAEMCQNTHTLLFAFLKWIASSSGNLRKAAKLSVSSPFLRSLRYSQTDTDTLGRTHWPESMPFVTLLYMRAYILSKVIFNVCSHIALSPNLFFCSLNE